MDKDSKFTRDEDGYVAVRTVSAPYSSGSDDKDSMFTRDEDGYVAVRVTGSGGGSGGDQHNLGWYATESALTTAYPTAEAGDWAIVGATDTVWVWDTDNSEWVDSDQKGQVTSVNNQTGAVTVQETLVSGTNIKTINSASLLGSGDLTIDSLPSQTGNSGKFLTTNGTSASWDTSVKQLRIKASSTIYCDFFVVSPIGGGTGIYFNSGSGQNVQLGGNFVSGLSFISKLYVREIYYGSHNSQGITVPAVGGTLALQIATMPTAGSTYKGTIYQFTGTTDSTYTNGHFYKCVSDGQTPATYSWEEISMGGGSSLPSQTGNAGKFLVTDGTDASWSNEIKSTDANVSAELILKSQNNDYAKFYKRNATTTNLFGISIYKSNTYNAGIDFNNNSIVVSAGNVRFGFYQTDRSFYGLDNNTILGTSSKKWANVYTTKINNGADITVPNTTGTMVVADYTGATQGQVLTLNSSGNAEWATPSGGGSTGTTASLVVANWSSNTQTVNVTGVTASNNVIVAPAPASQADYTAAGIICTAQANNSLTFSCQTVPTSAITVNVLILN